VETEGEARRRHDLENVPFDEPAAGDPATVVLDEIPLPRMFVPGKIAHVYTHDGGYKAAYVPRSFRDLRRISLASNMITRSVRRIPPHPPRSHARGPKHAEGPVAPSRLGGLRVLQHVLLLRQ